MRNIRERQIDWALKISGVLLICSFIALPYANAEEQKTVATDKNLEEQREILMMDNDKVFLGERKPGMTIEIEEVNLPVPVPKVNNNFPIPEAKIEGACFYKNNRPAYLIGAESALNQHPFLYKTLGFDIIQFTADYLNSTLIEKKEGNTVKLIWRYPKTIELFTKETVENGFLAYVQLVEEQRKYFSYPHLNDNFKDLFVTYGHFYLFRHDNPDAWKIRENAKKMVMSASSKYPVFAYELFNEVNFTDYGPKTLERFHQQMSLKYTAIDNANKVWGTNFKNFQEVQPPMKGGGGDSSFRVLGKTVSRMLWLDWLKFSEDNSADSFRKTYELIKKYDPEAYLTIQTHCQYFYDHGAHGVNPLLKSRAEDFYGDESGLTYFSQLEGYEDTGKINKMLQTLLWLDYLSGINPGKPQVSEETPLGGSYMDIKKLPHVADLHNSEWKFFSDNKEEGLSLGYHKPEYDDSAWGKIKVPDMWANQGHEKTRFAWYRYHFRIPKEFADRQIYLNGQELADSALIYLNGQEIFKTKSYGEQFGIDITKYLKPGENVLSISIKNDYFQANRYWGGIRGGISMGLVGGGERIPMNYGQMRSFFWERALHGEAGVFPSYFYTPEGSRHSVFDPQKINFSALKGIPQAKSEINSVGDLFLTKKPRTNAAIALVYPLEYMRYHIHKDATEMMSGPVIGDLSKWYGGLLFSGVPLAVVSNEHLAEKDFSGYRAVFMRGNDRIPEKLVAKIHKYVSGGGILVVDDTSLLKEDEFDKPLLFDELLGCRRTVSLKDTGNIDLSAFNMSNVSSVAKKRDASSGTVLELNGGKAMAFDDKKNLAVVLNSVGKGKVYVIGCELADDTVGKLLQTILQREGISPAIQLTGAKGLAYVEKHFIGEKGRYLLYFHNWGSGPNKAHVKLSGELMPGNYNISNLETGVIIAKNMPTLELQNKGFDVELQSQTPLALIVEEKNLVPVKISGLSDEQRKWLDYIDRPSPKNIPVGKRVLMDSAHLNQYSRIHLLPAAKLLEDNGYEVNVALGGLTGKAIKTYTDHIGLENLSDYGIFFLGGMRNIEVAEADKISAWVKDGGSVFICGNWYRGPHGWLNNSSLTTKLYSKFGAAIENTSFTDAASNFDDEPCYPVFLNIAESEITKTIGRIYTQGMAVLNLKDPEWQPLVKGNKTSNYPDKPAMAIRNFGKGKIVLCGDPAWLKPELMEKGDNRKLFMNLMNWLSGEDRGKNGSSAP
jgi:hypothetical protein